jgi:hypothetical protein
MNLRRLHQQHVVETTTGVAHYWTSKRVGLSVNRMDPLVEVGDDAIEPYIQIVFRRLNLTPASRQELP